MRSKQPVLSLLILVMLVMAPFSSASAYYSQEVEKDIEIMLVCQDGCNMVLASCDNETAKYMRKIIIQKLEAGETKAEILDYFVEKYGEKVLTAPDTKIPFNLTAWLTPFIAIIIGAIGIYALIYKWVLKAEEAKLEENQDNQVELTSEQQAMLDEELKKYM